MNKEQSNILQKKIKDNLLYLHENFDDNGEYTDKRPKELAKEDWKDIDTLLRYTLSLGQQQARTHYYDLVRKESQQETAKKIMKYVEKFPIGERGKYWVSLRALVYALSKEI